MRDRLIELLKKADEYASGVCTDYGEAQEVCADYLLAAGVIVPPMALGQTCFSIYVWGNRVDKCRVSSITQKMDGSLKIRIVNLYCGTANEIHINAIGKTVFLTREEAEKALAERREG